MKSLLLAVLCLLAPLPTLAQQNCDRPTDDFDGLYCLNKIYIETDAELNQVYRDLAPRLTPKGRSRLKETQLAWIEDRNSSCSRKIDSGFYVNLSCATSLTRSRLQFLQERVRECKSSGCLPSKL
ncbi:lysozyme inhibitor LprI family protein [Anthocerotibacter panamensis]|uniref:lysozyme inhibitor LprI family protein n=1 Tax=Anthocerotibacter panamensis TaxID=2857077 RepID=UPI001C4058EA